jgi:hypothetical protein
MCSSITIDPAEFVRSLGFLGLAGATALVALLAVIRGGDRQRPRSGVLKLLREEEGAAYSLSYVLTFPFFLLIVCLIIEIALLLIVKTGTTYAAYAGARAHIVWRSTKPSSAEKKTRLAAVRAMVPFASSAPEHARGLHRVSVTEELAYLGAYRIFAPKGKASTKYLLAKYRYADGATTVTTQATSGRGDADIATTVSYEMPFQVPGIGRIFGHRAPWPGARFYTWKVRSTVTLQNEGSSNKPLDDPHPIGIDYDPDAAD